MKVSSAVTMTTVLSILSATHAAPVLSVQNGPDTTPVHAHYRRASSVSELAGREYGAGGHLDGLNFAHEGPANHIKTLFNLIKRQLGGTSSSTASTTTGQGGSPSTPHETGTGQSRQGNPEVASHGLMGGGMSSPGDAGFAFEPGQSLGDVLP